MRFFATLVLAFGIVVPVLAAEDAAAAQQPPTDQTKRGQELFLKSPKGIACGTCHSIAGVGTAVGPDLKNLASFAMPRGMVMAIKMNSTETVQSVSQAGVHDSYPARIVEKQGGMYKLWNLSSTPPVLLTLPVKEVKNIERDQKWKHPPASAGYTTSELADIVGYLRWAATGNQKVVTVEEVGTSQ